MYKIISFVFLCLFLVSENIYAQDYQSAHIITVGVDVNKKGKVTKKYVFFGLLNNGKLSTFGGLRDQGEKNPKVTAAREAEEEALGVFGNQKTIKKWLKNISPCFEVDGHICYVLPERNYGKDVSTRFKQIRFDKKIKLSRSQKEMVDIIAVDVYKIREKVLQNEALHFEDNEGVLRPVRIEAPLIEAVLNGHL
jgi:hypothetical protein